MKTIYDKCCQPKDPDWGLQPLTLCYEILKLTPPVKDLRELDVVCSRSSPQRKVLPRFLDRPCGHSGARDRLAQISTTAQ